MNASQVERATLVFSIATLVLLTAVLLVPACDVPSSSATDAHADAGDVDVTPAEQPCAVAQALVAAKPLPPDPGPMPGPIVVGGPNDPAVCGAEYWWCVGGCNYSPFLLLCQNQCYRNYLLCRGIGVGP